MEYGSLSNKTKPLFDSLIEIARIVKPQGLKGELKVLTYSRDPADIRRYHSIFLAVDGDLKGEFYIEKCRINASAVILKLKDIENREHAESLRNCSIWIHQDQLPRLPAGEYFIRDLIGLQVFDEQGVFCGTMVDVLELPANDVFVIDAEGRELLIPAVSEFVQEIHCDLRRIVIRLPDGISDEPI
jgi:16S rRNA processing protein RimM